MADSILIWESAQDSRGGGHWTDEIICTRRKDGTFSLRPRKRGDDGTLSPAGKTRIRSPEVFVRTLLEMADSLGCEIDHKTISDEICKRIDKLDRNFSQKIRAYVGASR